MKTFLLELLLFAFSSTYVLLLDFFAYSSRGLQKSLVLPIVIILILIYRAKVTSWETFMQNHGKWFLLLWGTILIQTLVIATGGFQSPFLILIHLFMIGISFLFSFTASVIFLLFSFIALFIDIAFTRDILLFLKTEPSTILLQLVSLLSIIPISYIISRQYHIKDMVSRMLSAKVEADEAIFERINELIIVTDDTFNILSVNDAVERTLLKPRSEIITVPLLSALLLRSAQGKLITNETLLKKNSIKRVPTELPGTFTIMQGASSHKNVSIQVQSIKDIKENASQYIFILSFTDEQPHRESLSTVLDKARVKYEAMNEALKALIRNGVQQDVLKALLTVQKIENDLYYTQFFATNQYTASKTNIDVAVLTKNIVEGQKEFAQTFQIPLNFRFENFGEADIAPLTVKNYPVKPEQLTGPFFTIPCDVKSCEIVMKKLLDVTLFLASSTPGASVDVSIARTKKHISIEVSTINPNLKEEQLEDIFLPNYGKLVSQTNVMAGSGLEGYLVHLLCQKMQTPLDVRLQNSGKALVFTLKLKKAQAKSAPKQ